MHRIVTAPMASSIPNWTEQEVSRKGEAREGNRCQSVRRPPPASIHLNEATPKGGGHRLSAVLDAQLVEDVLDVSFDCAFADAEDPRRSLCCSGRLR